MRVLGSTRGRRTRLKTNNAIKDLREAFNLSIA